MMLVMVDVSVLAERLARFRAREERARSVRSHGNDVRATAALAVDATQGVMDVVRDMQRAFSPPVIAEFSALVHAAVRGVTGIVGAGVDVTLAALAPALGASAPGMEREAVLAALNGVVGDRLAATKSPLAIDMALAPPLDERKQGTLLVFVHGSCMNDLQWTTGIAPTTHDHGRALLGELEDDVTLAYLRYNSGRHVKHNGEDLAALLERESAGFDAVMLVAHSMGGLVARSAAHAAEARGHAWRNKLAVLVTLGSPHHGSPLERAGNLFERVLGVTPWTAPIASLGMLRSAGVTDLRYGNVVDVDTDRFALAPDARTHAPLPAGVCCYAIAATKTPTIDAKLDAAARGVYEGLADDNLVPVESALGVHADPARTLRFDDARVLFGTDHLGLLASREVHALLRQWCAHGRVASS